MASFWKLATSNAFNTALNGNIGSVDTSMTLNNTTGLQTPCVLVIDRVNASGTATPTIREYVSGTGIAGATVSGLTRGLGGSTAQSHSSGAIVEEVFTMTHWNDLLTLLLNVFTSTGTLDTTKVVDLTTAQTLTNKTLTSPTITGTIGGNPTITKPTLNGSVPALTSDVDGATVTFDMSASNVHTVTLGGNRTLALSNVSVGQVFIIRLLQDASGSRTVAWFTTIKWAGGSAPTLTTTASKADTFGFLCTSAGNYDGYVVGQNI